MNAPRLALIGLVATLSIAACSSDSTTVEPSPANPTSTTADTTAGTDGTPAPPADLDERIATSLDLISEGYAAAAGIWNGFVPNDHPTVLPFRTAGGDVVAALAINHPSPHALGDATEIDSDALAFDSVHRIDDPTDVDTLEGIVNFDFHAQLGGVDSFALNANAQDSGDQFFDSTTRDFTATLLHEMFHRYQDDAFTGSLGNQDVNGYDYSPENLELAVLEDRALADALTASDDETRELAARRFAALRLARFDADPRVTLDNSQEMFEGTARYIEHRISSGDEGYVYSPDNYANQLTTDFQSGGIKDSFGFGRFYASGAAVLGLLDQLGVHGVDQRVEAGEGPAEILIAELGVTLDDATALVDDARSAYDPERELPAASQDASAQAADEPDPFGDAPGGDAGTGGDGEFDDAIEITDEEIACMEELGADLSDENSVISEEVADACLT